MINSKNIFYRMYQEGLFGNKLRTWNTLEDALNDPYNDLINCRHFSKGTFKSLWNVPKRSLKEDLARHCKEFNLSENEFRFNEVAEDNFLTIQGELQECNGYRFFYNTEKTNMREAMKNGKESKDLTAKMFLKKYCDPNSYEWLNYLLDKYPNHVIEFSTYSKYVGCIPRRNTIIWEVRNY